MEYEEDKQDVSVSEDYKSFLRRIPKGSLKAFAIFVAAMMIISAMNAGDMIYNIDLETDLPWEATFYPPFAEYTILKFVNAMEDTPVVVKFENVTTESELWRDGMIVGTLEAERTNYYVFTVCKGTEPELSFYATYDMYVKVDRIPDSEVTNVTNAHVFGETFYKIGTNFIADFVFESREPKDIILSSGGELAFMAVTEFPAYAPGISRRGEIRGDSEIIKLPAGTEYLRLISEGIVDFDMDLFPGITPGVAMIDVIGTSQPSNASKYVRTMSPVEQVYNISLGCGDPVDIIAEGATTIYTIWVTNIGNGEDTFNLSVEQKWSATLSTDNVTLGQYETADVILTVTAPQGSAGQFVEINVTGVSQGNTSKQDTLTTITHSEIPIFDFYMSYEPPIEEQYPSQPIIHDIVINNVGNVQDAYDLEVYDCPGNWTYLFPENPVTVDACESMTVPLVLFPPINVTAGDYFITVNGTSHNDTNLTDFVVTLTRICPIFGVDLSPDSQTKTDSPRSTEVVFPLLVQNSGNAYSTILFEVQATDYWGLFNESGAPVDMISLLPWESAELYLHTITAPDFNQERTVAITGISLNDSNAAETVYCVSRTVPNGVNPSGDGIDWVVSIPMVPPGDVIIPVQQGDVLNYTFTVTNKGEQPDVITFTLVWQYNFVDPTGYTTFYNGLMMVNLHQGLFPYMYDPNSWTGTSQNSPWFYTIDDDNNETTYFPGQIMLNVNETRTMYLRVHVPDDAPLGEESKIIVAGVSTSVPTTCDTFRKTFIMAMGCVELGGDPIGGGTTAPPFPEVAQGALFDMTIDETIKTVRPGDTVNYTIEVRNLDLLPTAIDFEIYHVPGSWTAELYNTSVYLEPYQAAEINLNVTSPPYAPAAVDSDLDNLIDSDEELYCTTRLDPDSDDDMFWDGPERDYWLARGENTSTIIQYLNSSDVDGDGLVDGIEVMKWFTDPLLYDSDEDNCNDLKEIEFWEEHYQKTGGKGWNALGDADGDDLINILDPHSDEDSALDGSEIFLYAFGPDYESNPAIFDTDNDGVDDYIERLYNCMPNNTNTDDDGLSDYDEIYVYTTSPTDRDTDNDGLIDGNEIILDNATTVQYGVSDETIDIYRAVNDPGSLDHELLENVHCSYDNQTNATNPDTDGDGMLDGWELFYGLDPMVSDINDDSDTDNLTAIEEFYAQTNPTLGDSDGDDLSDDEEVVIVFRTNIENGAVSNISYDYANSTHWLYLDIDHNGYGDKYYYDSNYTTPTIEYDEEGNITDAFEGSSVLDDIELFLTLEDGTTIFINFSSFDTVYVWTPNADHADWNQDGNLTGKCYKFIRDETDIQGKNPTELILEDQELLLDTDQDGSINAVDMDSDDDGMPDWWEVDYGLNYTNASDAEDDSDDDGLGNLDEYNAGTHPTDFPPDVSSDEAKDYDGDGMLDGWEAKYDMNPKNDTGDDGPDGDMDNDGLTNIEESNTGGSPIDSDSDGDGLPDGWEVEFGLDPTDDLDVNGASGDPDEDGLVNSLEYQYGTYPNVSADVTILDARDFDGDGLPDGWEEEYGLNLTDDGSGFVDNGDQGDPDDDGILNIDEYGFDKPGDWQLDDEGVYWDGTNPISRDTDSDDLDDNEEDVNLNHIRDPDETDPRDSDTDNDGLSDGDEIVWGTDALIDDTDEDGLTDGDEAFVYGTNPVDPDTDDDGISDGDEITRAVRDDWTMFQHDAAHTGYSTSSAPDEYNLSWDFEVVANDSIESVIASDGLVFVVTSLGMLYALYENTGQIIWEYDFEIPVNATLASYDGTLFIGGDDGKLYAFDEVEGTLLWNYTTGSSNYTTGEHIPGTEGPVHTPTIYGNTVLFGSEDCKLYALVANLPDDQIVGVDDDGDDDVNSSRIDEEIYDWTNNDNDYYIDLTGDGFTDDDPIILDNGTIQYKLDELDTVLRGSVQGIANGTNMTPLIDEDCRRLIWSLNLSSGIESSPAIVDDIVYVGTDDGILYVINFKTGKKMWQFSTGGPIFSSPSVANGKVFVRSDDGNIYALDADTGREIWNVNIGPGINSLAIGFSTYFDMNLIFATSGNTIWALKESDGVQVWSHWGSSSPIVADGMVFVGTSSGAIYAYDIDGIYDGINGTGVGNADLIWDHWFGGDVSTFGIVDGFLFVGADKLYVIGGEDAGLQEEKMTHSIDTNLAYEREFAVLVDPHWDNNAADRIYVYDIDKNKVYNFSTGNYNNVAIGSGNVDTDDFDEIGAVDTDDGTDDVNDIDDVHFYNPTGSSVFHVYDIGEVKDITVGNFDSDSAIEFAVLVDPPTHGDRIYVYDSDHTTILYNFSTGNYNVAAITSGNVDADSVDEIGTVDRDDGTDDANDIDDVFFYNPSGSTAFSVMDIGELKDITVGNFDSDSDIEFAVLVDPPSGYDRIYVYDSDHSTIIYNFSTGNLYVVAIASGDVDADDIDEIGTVDTDDYTYDKLDDVYFYEPSGSISFYIYDVGELLDITVAKFRNLAPTADAGSDQSKHIAGSSVSFNFNAGGSSDPDGEIKYYWDFGDGSNSGWIYSATTSHTYNKPCLGKHVVTLTVKDAFGSTDQDSLNVTITDIAPVANAGSDQPDVHISGSSVRVYFNDASASDSDDALSTLSYLWTFGDGNTKSGTGSPVTYHDYTGYPQLKTYTVTLEVTDPYGLGHTDTVNITITNQEPTANISSAKVGGVEKLVGYPVYIHIGGSPVTVRFDGEPGSDDPDGDSLEYKWWFSDTGSWSSWDDTYSYYDHAYSSEGTYSVSLKVRDGYHSVSEPDTITVIVYNNPPVAEPAIHSSTPSPIRPNTSVKFDGSDSWDPDDEDNSTAILNYTWTFQYGGEVTLYGVTPTFTFSNTVYTEVYTVTLTVTDPFGEYDAKDLDVTVVNDRPTAIPDIDNSPPIRPDTVVQFNGGGSYDDNGDGIANYSWDISYNNKYVENIYVKLYGKNPTYVFDDVSCETPVTVILNVTDIFGAKSTNSNNTMQFTIINNRPKDVEILQGDNVTVHVGYPVTLTGSGVDPDDDDLYYSWDFGDGTTPTQPDLDPMTSHQFGKVGVFTVILKVEDPFGLYNTTITRVTVTDNAPEILICEFAPPEVFAMITPVDFIADAIDPDEDFVEYHWDFGDNHERPWAPDPNAVHIYDKSGVYVVTLTVIDKIGLPPDEYGKANSTTFTIHVLKIPPIADAGSDQTVRPNELVWFDGTGSHEPDGDTLRYSWDFDGDGVEDSFGATPTYRFKEEDVYEVNLTVTNIDGTTDWDTCLITVESQFDIVDIAIGGAQEITGDPIIGHDYLLHVSNRTNAQASVTLFNNWQSTSKARVVLYEGYLSKGRFIGYGVGTISGESEGTITIEWNPAFGYHSLYAVVEYEDVDFNIPIVVMSQAVMVIGLAQNPVNQLDPMKIDSDDDQLLDGLNITVEDSNPLFGILSEMGIAFMEGGDGNVTFIGEQSIGTDPSNPDTDLDFLEDYTEITTGTDPFDSDTDHDGIPDGVECNILKTSPLMQDSDGDGLWDGEEVMISFRTNAEPGRDRNMTLEYCEDTWIVIDPDDDFIFEVFIFDSFANSSTIPEGTELETPTPDGYPVYYNATLNKLWIDTLEELFPLYIEGTSSNAITSPYPVFYFQMLSQEVIWDIRGLQTNDTDSDGLLDPFDTYKFDDDSDDDGLSDGEEGSYGTDPLNPDSDDDGVNDGDEVANDTDPSSSVDTDMDGLPNWWEVLYGLDPHSNAGDNGTYGDFDNDGLSNIMEFELGLIPAWDDSDGDGMNDSWEVEYGLNPRNPFDAVLDYDLDGLINLGEFESNTNPVDWDDDGDGMPDGWELLYNLDPKDPNDAELEGNDNDDLVNLEEYLFGVDPTDWDSDDDGMPDGWEVYYGLNPRINDSLLDMDGDGSLNLGEYTWNRSETWNEEIDGVWWNGTNPNNWDTDGDGMKDGWEVKYGLDPTDDTGINGAEGDPDCDCLPNIDEYRYAIVPIHWDSDGDKMPDGWEVHHGLVPFVIDDLIDRELDGMTNIDEFWWGVPDKDYWLVESTYNLNGKEVKYLANGVWWNGTNPNERDTDGDGMYDGWEVKFGLEPLDDGTNTLRYNKTTRTYEVFGAGMTVNGPDGDPDEDFAYNIEEFRYRIYPNESISEGITLLEAIDFELDGMQDGWEIAHGLIPYSDDSERDKDQDGLPNIFEHDIGTNPKSWDTDSDGLPDGWELKWGLDPLDDGSLLYQYNRSSRIYESFPGGLEINGPDGDAGLDSDLAINIDEYRWGICPIYWDSDDDKMPDGWEVIHGLIPFYQDDLDDFDRDKLTNIEEFTYGLDIPLEDYNATLDGVYCDGLDPYDIDTDDDGVADGWELWYNLDPKDDGEYLWVWDETEKEFVKSDIPGNLDNGRYGDPDEDYAYNWEEYYYGIHANISEKFGVLTKEDAQDSDNDTMPDGWEVAHKLMPSYDDRLDDLDGDTLANYFEFQKGLDPFERDTDVDCLPDNWELIYCLDPLDNGTDILEWDPVTREYESIGSGKTVNGAYGDPDGDWSLNWEEYVWVTHPNVNENLTLWDAMDKEHDGMPDGYEIRFRLDPHIDDSARDLDGDSLSNIFEYSWTMPGAWNFTTHGVWWNGTSPINPDTEKDRLPDDWEIKYDFDPLDDGTYKYKYDWISRTYVVAGPGGWVNGTWGDPDDEASQKPENLWLPNIAEYENNTHPRSWDTDSDLIDDWWEIYYETYPLSASADLDLDEDLLTNFEEYNREAMVNGYMKSWEGQTYPRIKDTDEDGISDGGEIKNYFPYMKVYSWNYYSSIGTVTPGSKTTQISPQSNATYNFLLEDDDVYTYYYLIVYTESGISPIVRGGKSGETLLTMSAITGGYQSNYFLIKPENIDSGGVGGYFVDVGNPDTSKVLELTSVVLYRQGGLDPLITDSDDDDVIDGDEISLDNGYLTFPFNRDTDFDLLTDGYEIEMGLNPNPDYSSRINTVLLHPYDSSLTEDENRDLAEEEVSHYFEENFLMLLMFIGTDPGDELKDSKGDPMLEQGFNEIIVPFAVLYKSELYDAYSSEHFSGLPDDAVFYEKGSNYSTKKIAHISFGIDADDAVDLVKTLMQDGDGNEIANASDITFDMSSIFNAPDSSELLKVMTLITFNKETITDVSIVPELFQTLYGIMEQRGFGPLDDGNGTSLMTDTDSDGLSDWGEATCATDVDGDDTDGDWLIDGDECYIYWTSPIQNDTDQDLLYDGDEAKPWDITCDDIPNVNRDGKWFVSDPTLFDSDGDKLNDSEEITTGEDTYITDPMEADTDGDGLNDGEEKFERVFSIDRRVRISMVILGFVINTPAEIKDVRVGGRVISAVVKIGINHDKPEELSDFTLKYGSETVTIDNPNKNGNPDKNTSVYLIHDIVLNDESWPDSWNGTWRLSVSDNVQNDEKGTIEQFELVVIERCNPNEQDTDDDDLTDWEEVNLGEYGYITDPTVDDTDLDTIEDGDEVKGTSPSGIRSDPTKKDTDMDGYNDNEDKDPLNDLILQVKVYKVKSCSKYEDDKMKIKIEMKGKTFVSKSLKQSKYISFYASVDISDKNGVDDSVSVFFDAWQADSGFWDFDGDTALKLDKTVSHQVMSNGKHGHTEGYAKGSGKRWGAVWYDIDTVILKKDKTILIVPKDGSKTYTAPKTGYLRYTGEQRFYVFVLAVDEEYTETIIVPESIYYDSKLGSILLQGEEAKDDIPKDLRDIEFSEPDDSQASLSIAIRGVHAATVKSSQVSTIIKYLTMNKTGETPYEAIDITSNVFTVGLPEDVLDLIPIVPPKISEQGKINEGFWASLAAALSDIAGFIWNGICAIGEFLASVATFVVNLGLAVLGAIWDAICAIANAILAALNFLLNFIIGLIKAAVNMILKPLFTDLFNAIKAFSDALVSFFNGGTKGSATRDGDSGNVEELKGHMKAFGYLATLAMAISAAITIMYLAFKFILPGGSIIDLVLTAILSIAVAALIGAITAFIGKGISVIVKKFAGAWAWVDGAVAILSGILAFVQYKKGSETGLKTFFKGTWMSMYGLLACVILPLLGAIFSFQFPNVLTAIFCSLGLALALVGFSDSLKEPAGSFNKFFGPFSLGIAAVSTATAWTLTFNDPW